MNCASCQDLMLDFVYDLLDEPDAAAVREHVATCPACAAALAEAKADQRKLGQAALAIVQVPVFQLPTEDIPADTAPAPVVPVTAKPRRIRTITIAAWLATIACCVVAAFMLLFNHRQLMGEQETVVANLIRQNDAIDAKLASLNTRFAKEQKELPELVNKETLQVHLAGPGHVTPGASAGFQVALRDLDDKPHVGRVDVEYVNAKNEPIARQQLEVAGAAEIPVPTELARNHGEVRMKVVATSAGKAIGTIEETIVSQAPALNAHVAVNKMLYKPGERMLVRALALDRVTLMPAAAGTKLTAALLAENGNAVVPAIEMTTLAGMGASQISLPPNLAEGAYTLEVRGPDLAPVRRRIDVLPTVAPAVDVIVQNNRFKAGQPITQQVQIFNPDGSPAANQPVAGNAAIGNAGAGEQNNAGRGDGRNNGQLQANQGPYNFQGRTDEAGRYQITLPGQNNLQTGRQIWQADLSYGEKKQKAVVSGELHVQPSRVVVDFYPEGGHLIAGATNKIFYRVRAPEDGAPATARIAIVSSKGRVFESLKDTAFGSFDITPDPKERYTLKILAPQQEDVAAPFAKLAMETAGVLLRGAAVQDAGKPLTLALENRGGERLVQIIATCRGQIVFHERIKAAEGQTPLTIKTPIDGLLRVTALEAKDGHFHPLTERLFFQTPARRLDLVVDAKSDKAGPQNSVDLKVTARDEHQRPAACWSLASVVDDRVHGDTPEPTLAAHFLLLGDAPADIDLADLPAVALDGGANRGDLETILGVFGWRRVGAQSPTLLAKDGAKDRRQPEAKEANGARAAAQGLTFFSRVEPSLFELRQRLIREYEVAQMALLDAANQQRAALTRERVETTQTLARARQDLDELARRPRERILASLVAVALVLLVVAVGSMIFGLVRLARRRPAAMSFAVACGCLAVCLALLVGRPPEAVDSVMRQADARPAAEKDFRVDRAPLVAALEKKAIRDPNATLLIAAQQGEAMIENEAKDAKDLDRAARGAERRPGDMEKAAREQNKVAALRGMNQEARRATPPAAARQFLLEQQLTKQAAKAAPAAGAPVAGPPAPGGFGGAAAPVAPSPMSLPKMAAPMADAQKGDVAEKKDAAKKLEMPTGPAASNQAPMSDGKRAEVFRVDPALDDLAKKQSESANADKAGDKMKAAKDGLSSAEHAKSKSARIDLNALNRDFAPRRSQDLADPATVLWNPALRIPEGGTSLRLDLPTGANRYRVLLFGHTEDGRLGSYDAVLSPK